jgi:predicted Fe-Mo cluster-binding NifX family protein
MKIAIPTENKIVVSNDPRRTGYFKIVTLKGEDIVYEEYRSNPVRRDNLCPGISSLEADKLLTLLSDCDMLLCSSTDRGFLNSRIRASLDIIETDQLIITAAVLEYNSSFLYNARNTCCSP